MFLALLFSGINSFQTVNAAVVIVGPQNYLTIQAAINAAAHGDTIFINPGIYKENLVINKTLTLIGANSTTTIIDGAAVGTVVFVTVNDVTISNLTITNGKTQQAFGSGGIEVGYVQGLKILNNIISYNQGNLGGIGIAGGKNNYIAGNQIEYNNGSGIHYWGNGSELNATIENNIIRSNGYAIHTREYLLVTHLELSSKIIQL
jgi:nitrous oxidase accessory protein